MTMTESHVAAVHHGAGKKLGPLPVWAWGAVLGLGVVAYMYFKNRSSAATAAPATNDAGAVTGGSVTPDLTANDLGTVGDYTGQTNGTTAMGQTLDNAAWLAQADAYMVTQGKSPLAVQQALDAYLNGSPLSWTQQQYVSTVVAKYGLPPQGVTADSPLAPAPVAPAPKPAPKPAPLPAPKPLPLPTKKPAPIPVHKPTGTRWVPYKIVWGDTLTSIAERHHTSVSALASHNHIANPNKIYAGHTIQVPA
jgi:LysM repeat protein